MPRNRDDDGIELLVPEPSANPLALMSNEVIADFHRFHSRKIYYGFGAACTKAAIAIGCHFLPTFVAGLRDIELETFHFILVFKR